MHREYFQQHPVLDAFLDVQPGSAWRLPALASERVFSIPLQSSHTIISGKYR